MTAVKKAIYVLLVMLLFGACSGGSATEKGIRQSSEGSHSDAKPTEVLYSVRFDDESHLVVDLPGLANALSRGADPNWLDRTYKHPRSTLGHFVWLCSSVLNSPEIDAECTEAIKLLIGAGARLQPADQSILYLPIALGKVQIVALLLNLGADPLRWPNDEVGTQYSPIETAQTNDHQAVVELLVANGASKSNEKDVVQWRFLKTASRGGSLESLKRLLKKGADVNGKGRDGEVALIEALRSGSPCSITDRALYLLQTGANPNGTGRRTFELMVRTTTPLHQAVWQTRYSTDGKNFDPCVEELLTELIVRGAHVSLSDVSGRTPLHIAAESDQLFAAQLLLKSGSKVMPRDKEGKTPLGYAKSGEMIKLFKSHGATEH